MGFPPLGPAAATARALLLIFAMASGAAAGDPGATSVALPALERFLAWFPGAYDNHEQVWQERLDAVSEPHERLHLVVAPVTVPAAGTHVLYARDYLDGDRSRLRRQRLYALDVAPDGGLRMRVFRFADADRFRRAPPDPARLATLTAAELLSIPGCDVSWHSTPDGRFEGRTDEARCSYRDRVGRALRVRLQFVLTDDGLELREDAFGEDGARIAGREDGVPLRYRKARLFTGWAGVKVRGPAALAADDEWHSTRSIRMHDEGDRWRLLDAAGAPTGYAVELARLTYQETRTAVLKLGLIDEKSGETVAYAWANPEAERIGINLRWAQIGLTLERDAQPGASGPRSR